MQVGIVGPEGLGRLWNFVVNSAVKRCHVWVEQVALGVAGLFGLLFIRSSRGGVLVVVERAL